MRKFLLCLLFSLNALHFCFAQTAVDSVKATIDQMFSAMKNSEPNIFLGCFNDSAIMQTIARDRNGNTIIKTENVLDFALMVGKMSKGMADERITYDQVKVDGPMATAWVPYQFYLNGVFSHCGVNSFQLVRFGGAWKIQYLIDTRRKDGCQ